MSVSSSSHHIKVVPLGAGQDVGRSCVIVTLGRKTIMFDCGMHMGYNDERRFPDFKFISKNGQFTQTIDCVIISHFHLDHCGALPYFTEVCGYDGPIYMTYPTKAIAPILLEDYRRVMVDRKGDISSNQGFFSSEDIKNCIKKVQALNLHQTVILDDELEIKPYYAGHVLGAAMFYVKDLATGASVVYTGDYNMTADRHLGSATIDRCRPDLLITETTYATTIRDSKSSRERDFCKQIYDTVVNKKGKVLIPVFALGRVQELCILLETYWERKNLGKSVPIYFSAGMVEKANYYYQLYINWTNEKIKTTLFDQKRNLFNFSNILPFERALMDMPGPMVLFATPGMLHAGMSLEVFKKWASSENNKVILPGYCVEGTVGNKVLRNKDNKHSKIEIDSRTTVDMRCEVKPISFSAHADAKGILQLIRTAQPKNVMLVHGERDKMAFFKKKIESEFKIPCFDPPNGCTIKIKTDSYVSSVNVSLNLLKRTLSSSSSQLSSPVTSTMSDTSSMFEFNNDNQKRKKIEGILISKANGHTNLPDLSLLEPGQAARELGLRQHTLSFTRKIPISPLTSGNMNDSANLFHIITNLLEKQFGKDSLSYPSPQSISLKSIKITFDLPNFISVNWLLTDEIEGERVCQLLDHHLSTLKLNMKQ
ncbi:hypothetical protein C9374_009568 [Naegleria lovaniensis]|uniref:Integrator complex subunit 11 n=1 Tax=Naegleria lovaniensis TaxID=51637 RepID=A0AA88KR38_NAELO|nr:uncharacterized protein C9374_009568 [Naegleria lovaniensis]KAG2392991.1 hypothetical protein C9374_009568 [Naegleria lovaniensis]